MNEEKVIELLLKHNTDIGNIQTYLKEEVATKKDLERISTTLDEMVGMMKKRDQEITMLQYRTQENTEDIKQVKAFVHFK